MTFNTKTIARILGLSVRQIDYWDRTHFIKPSIREASGYGSVRLYSFSNLVQLKVAKTLMDKGISLQKIRKAINYLKKNIPEVKKPLSEIKFLTDGETIFVLTEDKKVIIDVLKSGQLVFAVALGKIIEDLKGEVITLQSEKKYEVTVRGKKYSVILHPGTEGRGHWIECPALAGCASQGDTVEEALEMIKDAIKGHFEAAKEQRKLKNAI
jgi:predicted RNase H-like HicB family nuclease